MKGWLYINVNLFRIAIGVGMSKLKVVSRLCVCVVEDEWKRVGGVFRNA